MTSKWNFRRKSFNYFLPFKRKKKYILKYFEGKPKKLSWQCYLYEYVEMVMVMVMVGCREKLQKNKVISFKFLTKLRETAHIIFNIN